MNEIEELQEEIKSLTKELSDRELDIIDLEDDFKAETKKCYKLEDERDDLQEKLDDIEENKEESLELLKKLWLHQGRQSPYDKEIHELLYKSGCITNYQTPYFIKPL
tara:strand:+ start:2981 stop:3301 length:321 start_codon:yes stop_codon:yes gene_type:complete